MPESDARTEIGELWRQVNRQMHDRFKQVFRDSDLPFGAMIALRHIQQMPGVTVSELARRSGVVKSHVSSMMDQLARRRYVEKRTDPEDQRLVRVYVAQGAVDQMAEMETRMREAWSGALDEVPDDQLEEVARGLRILLTALENANRGTPGH